MHRILIILYCALCVCFVKANDTIRVLCIGNSFSWDAVEQELVPLCNATRDKRHSPQAIVIGNLYYGSCSLAQHCAFLNADSAAYEFRYITNDTAICYLHYTLMRALKDYDWDYITFQQVSHDSGIKHTYEPYLSILIDSVRYYQPTAQLCWHKTWSYANNAHHPDFPRYKCNQSVMNDSIALATQSVLQSHPELLLIPCADAITLARKRLGDTLCRDGYHLNYTYGRYLASCVWYEILTGKDVRKNPYRNPSMRLTEKLITQRIAHKIVSKTTKSTP